MALIVLANGVGVGYRTAPWAWNSQEASETAWIAGEFPEADFLSFNWAGDQAHGTADEYFLREALKVIQELQRFNNNGASDCEPTSKGVSQKRIVFVAQDIGVPLVKHVLLLVWKDVHNHWILFQTVALHLIKPPPYYDPKRWRQLCIPLGISSQLEQWSTAFANLEVEFSTISGALNQKLYGVAAGHAYKPRSVSHLIWNEVAGLTGRLKLGLDPGYRTLQRALARPDADICNISLVPSPPGPGAYLESHLSFKAWLEDPGSSVLAVRWYPGSSHIYVASHIMHSLRRIYPGSNTLFLSFSFHRWDARRNSEQCLVSSAVRQLLILKPELFIRARYVAEAYSRGPMVSPQRLWDLFRHLLIILQHTLIFFVVDSVDECGEQIAAKLSSLAASRSISVPLKLVVTASTPCNRTSNIAFHAISLEDDGWRRVIRDVAAERVSSIARARPVWKESQQLIVERLCGGQDSIDHDVMLNLELLEQRHIPSTKLALKQFLSTLPTTAYSATVRGLQLAQQRRAKLAINWIFYALRPLTISELAVALALGTDAEDHVGAAGNLTFSEVAESVSWDLMRDLGDSLSLGIKIVDGHITIPSQTFRSHLETCVDTLIPGFHGYIADRCISYLSICLTQAREISLCREGDALHADSTCAALALREYAQIYWIDHYNLHMPTIGALDDKALRYICLCADQSNETFVSATYDKTYSPSTGRREYIVNDPLFLAAQIGLARVIRNLVQVDKHKAPEKIERAIEIAASHGNLNVVRELRPSSRPGRLALAACAAAEHGHVEILEYILETTDVSDIERLTSQPGGSNPLLLSTANGHTSVTEILLARGCNLRSVDESGNTAVHLASRLGDGNTLRALRSARPDDFKSAINSANLEAGVVDAFALVLGESPEALVQQLYKASRSPIHVAAQQGQLPILQELFGAQAITLRTGSALPSLIFLAAENGHLCVVRYLVEQLHQRHNTAALEGRKENNTDTKDLERALCTAIVNGHVGLVALLATAIDVEYFHLGQAVENSRLEVLKAPIRKSPSAFPDNEYDKLLVWAIFRNKVSIVRHLIRHLTRKGVSPPWADDERSIHHAARWGRESCLREILRRANQDIVRCKDSGSSPLDIAAESSHLEAFKLLLEWEQPGSRRLFRTLRLAIKAPKGHGKLDLVRYLLDNGWSACAVNRDRETPLHIAIRCQGDDLDTIRLLLDQGSDPDARDRCDKSPLHTAAFHGHAKAARLLLAAGANPNQRSIGRTPLHEAIMEGHKEVVAALVGLQGEQDDDATTDRAYEGAGVEFEGLGGSRVNPCAVNSSSVTTGPGLKPMPKTDLEAAMTGTRRTPLIVAAEKGDVEVCTLLLTAGANPNTGGGDYGLPLHTALWKRNEKLVKLLMKYKADPNGMSRPFGTPLHVVCSGSEDAKSQRLGLVELLLGQDAKIDAQDYEGRTPIMISIIYKQESIIDFLLRSGANLDIVDCLGSSALHLAVRVSSDKIIQRLLEAGANADINDGCGRGLLYLAFLCGRTQLMDTVPEDRRAAHISAAMPALFKLDQGIEPFDGVFAETENQGINLNVPDRCGWTSLDLARSYELPSAEIERLQQLGCTEGITKREPTRLSPYDRSDAITVSEGGILIATEDYPSPLEGRISGTVRADYCVPIDKSIFYFEVEVIECGSGNIIAIGLSAESCPMNTMVGWGSSWAYRSDDGVFLRKNHPVGAGQKYRLGQTVGVVYDPTRKRLWFTLDGEKAGEALENVTGQLFPAISLFASTEPESAGPAKVSVTFPSGLRDAARFKYKTQSLRSISPSTEL
ncbi:Ankyrin-3 [Metarhizium anisopliae]